MTALALDHLVINTRFETDRAAELFAAMGFTLTPRGRHALGSINHLMVFQDDYLELIGLPTDGGTLRQEVLENPAGIDGLVFATDNADAVHAELTALGEAVQPLHAFSRPLELDGRMYEASFRTVRFQPGRFEAGRLYYCQHLTPELVWRAAWQQHANTASGLAGLLLVSNQPEADAAHYARVARGDVRDDGADGLCIDGARYTLRVVTPQAYANRYGDLACDSLGRGSFFGVIAIRIKDAAALAGALAAMGDSVRHRQVAGRTAVYVPGFNSLIEFVPGDERL